MCSSTLQQSQHYSIASACLEIAVNDTAGCSWAPSHVWLSHEPQAGVAT